MSFGFIGLLQHDKDRIQYESIKVIVNDASKVSTRFAHESVLVINPVVLDAKFYSLSDGIIFKGSHRTKTSPFWQIINFAPYKNFGKKKNLVRIRP